MVRRSGVGTGMMMIGMGLQTFRNRNRKDETQVVSKQDSLMAGIRTTAVNPGFILWWLTIGTTLTLEAKPFGWAGFPVFAGLHWFCDFAWYAVVALLIFKSHKFWTPKVHSTIVFFCVAVFVGFGAFFLGSSLWQVVSTPV